MYVLPEEATTFPPPVLPPGPEDRKGQEGDRTASSCQWRWPRLGAPSSSHSRTSPPLPALPTSTPPLHHKLLAAHIIVALPPEHAARPRRRGGEVAPRPGQVWA
mmetsp:Transcript_37836/g.59064  ORF Transcript_37836/g.59064 Transcript_37836/m.59064 type:complete len:104 (-) Transcript_37836:250-561(-)